jgi:hypothetical protein
MKKNKIYRTGLKFKVIETMKANPNWSSRLVAEHLNCDSAYVRVTAKRNGLSFPPFIHKGKNNLGLAAQKAGMTIKDIEEWAKQREKTKNR